MNCARLFCAFNYIYFATYYIIQFSYISLRSVIGIFLKVWFLIDLELTIAYFRFIIVFLIISSCTKIEAQYAVCNLAQNVDPFICYGILDD